MGNERKGRLWASLVALAVGAAAILSFLSNLGGARNFFAVWVSRHRSAGTRNESGEHRLSNAGKHLQTKGRTRATFNAETNGPMKNMSRS